MTRLKLKNLIGNLPSLASVVRFIDRNLFALLYTVMAVGLAKFVAEAFDIRRELFWMVCYAVSIFMHARRVT